MAIVENSDRRRVFGMGKAAHRLMPLHHRHGFRPQSRAQPVQFGNQVRHVGVCIGEDQRLQRQRMGQRVFNRQPATPGMPQQMHAPEVQMLPHRFGFRDIAGNRPQRRVGRSGRSAGAKLIESDDPEPLVDQTGMRLAQVITGESRTAVHAEQHVVARPEVIGHHRAALDCNLVPPIRWNFTPHPFPPFGFDRGSATLRTGNGLCMQTVAGNGAGFETQCSFHTSHAKDCRQAKDQKSRAGLFLLIFRAL